MEHWRQANTVRLVEWIRTEPDPRQRIGTIIDVGLICRIASKPRSGLGAARIPMCMRYKWTSTTSATKSCASPALEIFHDERQAQLFADWAVYLLVGYEQATLPPDKAALEWIVAQLLDTLDAGGHLGPPG